MGQMDHSDSVEEAILQTQENLRLLLMQHKRENWLQQGNIRIAEILNGDKEIKLFAQELINFLCEYLKCFGGTFYTHEGQNKLLLQYAMGTNENLQKEVKAEHTYFAQAIQKKSAVIIENISDSNFNLNRSLLNTGNISLIIIPLYVNQEFKGIIELSKFGEFSEMDSTFVEVNSKPISIYLNSLSAKDKLECLLEILDSKEQELQNRINAINKATLMLEFSTEGKIISVNDLFLKLSQYNEEELIGKHHDILSVKNETNNESANLLWEELKEGKNFKGEYQIQTKDGSALWVQASYTPVSDKNGNFYKVIIIGYDITLTKIQQTQIADISLSLKQQIEVLNKAAIVSETDAEGNILYVNDLFCKISGYEREELIGKNHRMLKSGKQPDGLFVGMWKALKMGLTWQGEILNKSKDGSYYWVDSTITPFKNKDGVIEKFVAIRFDITKQKESEALKKQTEALLLTQKDLEEANTELEAQSQKLQASEEELRVQQEELMQSNKELEEKSKLLTEKNHSFDLKNKELTEATKALEKKTAELELSSKYKSEFLANMSHELRTPLNSIILLSRLMNDNMEGNLSEDQLEYVSVINKAGNNLLELINDILDLSKIESGKMDINAETINLENLKNDIEKLFGPLSREKKINFSVVLDKSCPASIYTDRMRLDQVLKNFLSNAFKFTPEGTVKLEIKTSPDHTITFSVKDNGIGIPEEKQAMVFEAFKQADGSTKRKYGGTGLGLSISKEIAHLLGGHIGLESKPGNGSCFSLHIPTHYSENKLLEKSHEVLPAPIPSPTPSTRKSKNKDEVTEVHLDDDRKLIHSSDKTILVVEDDIILAKTYMAEARAKGFKVLVAMNGSDAVILAKKYLPSGIILDINLPQKNGWEVLKEVKEFAETSHIPVHIVSSESIQLQQGSEAGAVGVSPKPLTHEAIQQVLKSLDFTQHHKGNKILVISDKSEHRQAMENYLVEQGIAADAVDTDKNLEIQLDKIKPSLVILDISMRKIKITDIMTILKKHYSGESISVIILSSGYLSPLEQKRLNDFKENFNIRIVRNYADIASEIGLFFNYLVSSKKERKMRPPIRSSKILENRSILIVDDDNQNLLSIGGLLEMQGAKVFKAKDGKEALEIFGGDSGIELIIMDIMMPVMDGYETMKELRELPHGKKIPIITLTAKSQADEREKCLKAGASDFISKPVDVDQLIGLAKVWLTQNNN